MINCFMIKWKLKAYLDAHGLKPYDLVQRTQLAANTVYGMARGESKSARLDTLEIVVRTLRELTGQEVSIGDVVEIADKPDHDEAALEAEHKLWEGAALEPPDSPIFEPYDWGDVDPLTLGEPLTYVEGQGWVSGEVDKDERG